MTDAELQKQILAAIGDLPGPWNRELTMDDIHILNQLWHEWMFDAKGAACDHPERDRWQGYCWKCGRNVETEVSNVGISNR